MIIANKDGKVKLLFEWDHRRTVLEAKEHQEKHDTDTSLVEVEVQI